MALPNVEFVSNTLVKPYLPAALSSHPYLNTLVSLTLFDIANADCQVPLLYTFRPPMPDNQAMIDGLAKLLFHCPHLAGRYTTNEQGLRCILLNDAGARVIQTTVPTTLQEHLPLNSSRDQSMLHPPLEGVEELLQVQLNRFACGGVAIGLSCHHQVADGQSISLFFEAWAKMVLGFNLSTLPYHDRAGVTLPRNPPRCDFPHEIIEFKKKSPEPSEVDVSAALASTTRVCVHYSKDFIADLKTKVLNDGSDNVKRCSTFQCVLAHVWKQVTFARGLDDDVVTQVRIAVNGRARIKPPVPMEYFGNLVLWAFPRMKAEELLDASYARIVSSIQRAVAKVDDSYFKSFIDFGELMRQGEVGDDLVGSLTLLGEWMCADLETNSWLGFKFHDLDFGTGGPCTLVAPWLPIDGVTARVPSSTEEGGVDVFILRSSRPVPSTRSVS